MHSRESLKNGTVTSRFAPLSNKAQRMGANDLRAGAHAQAAHDAARRSVRLRLACGYAQVPRKLSHSRRIGRLRKQQLDQRSADAASGAGVSVRMTMPCELPSCRKWRYAVRRFALFRQCRACRRRTATRASWLQSAGMAMPLLRAAAKNGRAGLQPAAFCRLY